ncbi:Endothelin-converting enzyme 2, partial [Actinomortierella ambigua]
TNVTSTVNGQFTLGENIADNGGLRKAYETWYQRFKGGSSTTNKNATSNNNSNKNNQILPGLEKYTRDQLFFVSYAQLWCSKSTPEMAESSLILDTHAPSKWRVNGPVQNTPAFAQAFKCAEGSPMNPAKKCAVW